MRISKPGLFLIAFCLILPILLNAENNPAESEVATQGEAVTAVISEIKGEVTALIYGKPDWRAADEGMKLHSGDSAKTGRDASAKITFEGNSVSLGPDTYVVLKLEKNKKIELIDGELFVLIKNLPPGSTFEVRTPMGVCGARGTQFKVTSSRDESLTMLAVRDKKATLESIKEPSKSVIVNKYEEREISPWNKAIIKAKGKGLPAKELSDFMELENVIADKGQEITENDYITNFGGQTMIDAKRAAEVDAYRNLAEKIYGVVINSKTTLGDYAKKDAVIVKTVKGIVQGAAETDVKYYAGGVIEVTMETDASKVKNDLSPLTGDIFGFDCIPGAEKIDESDFEKFLL